MPAASRSWTASGACSSRAWTSGAWRGPGAQAALDAASTAALRISENQMLQSLFLDERGTVLADVIVGREEDGWLLLAAGPSPAELED